MCIWGYRVSGVVVGLCVILNVYDYVCLGYRAGLEAFCRLGILLGWEGVFRISRIFFMFLLGKVFGSRADGFG